MASGSRKTVRTFFLTGFSFVSSSARKTKIGRITSHAVLWTFHTGCVVIYKKSSRARV
jgi:hypothetical protein